MTVLGLLEIFPNLKDLFHREAMLKSRASWKGLDRKYLLSSDPYKNITLFL